MIGNEFDLCGLDWLNLIFGFCSATVFEEDLMRRRRAGGGREEKWDRKQTKK